MEQTVISHSAHPARLARRFTPAGRILNESVASLFWMHLRIPETVTRSDVEGAVAEVVHLVLMNRRQAVVAGRITELQRAWLPGLNDVSHVEGLAARLMEMVRRTDGLTRVLA